MSSIASGQRFHSRSRLPSVVLAAALVLATPDVSQPQGTSDGPPRQDDVPAPRQSTTKPPRPQQDKAPRDSTFWQRLGAAIVEGLNSRDTARPTMPNVVGMDTANAIRALRALRRFDLTTSYAIAPPPATSISVDRVVAQFPLAGTPVRRAVSARFTLGGRARAPDSVTVPRVIGLLADDAVRALRNLGLVEERLERRVTAQDSIGRVTGQNPAAGTRRARGGLVAIAIGQDGRVIMPKVTGLTLTDARRRIRDARIDISRIRRDSVVATNAIGTVVRQRPDSGRVVLPTTRIVLTEAVRAPRETTTVASTVVMPMVVGRDSGSAVRILGAAGLRNYRMRVPVNTTAADTVRAQTPDSGATIPSATNVVLTLGPPRPVDPIPDPTLPDLVLALPSWFRWLAAGTIALAVAAAGALTARAIWPPPTIVPRVRIQPAFTEIAGASGSLVAFSMSLRSHVEHDPSVLDLTGSPLE